MASVCTLKFSVSTFSRRVVENNKMNSLITQKGGSLKLADCRPANCGPAVGQLVKGSAGSMRRC